MNSLHFFAFSLLGLTIARLLLNWSKQRQAPGPFLAGISDLWRAYYQYRGLLRSKLLELHKKHGSIVRYGVNSISISDPSAIDIIYGSRAGFVTADSYKVLVGISNGKEVPSLVSTADESKHAALRRSVSKAFAPTGTLDYETFVDQTIPNLISAFKRHSTLDLSQFMLFYSMDAATRMSFSETLGSLQAESDVGGTIQLIRDRFNHWGCWSSLPDLERLVYRNPISMRWKNAPASMVAKAVSKLHDRMAMKDEDSHRDLLQKFIRASEEHPNTLDMTGVVSLLMSTISGAGDTTATTLTAIFYNLLKHQDVLNKLLDEIHGAELSDPPCFAQVSKLPYLNAVIKESMRVYSPITFPMERKVPAGGIKVLGIHFAEGTTVGCMPAAVHCNPVAFGPDAESFLPERWLEADEGTLRAMEMANLGFSRGRRVCLGQHVAVMQMKKVVVVLLTKFKMSLVDPDADLQGDMSATVVSLKPLYVRIEG